MKHNTHTKIFQWYDENRCNWRFWFALPQPGGSSLDTRTHTWEWPEASNWQAEQGQHCGRLVPSHVYGYRVGRFRPNLCSRENWARIDRVNGFHSCELYPLKSLITTNNWTLEFRLILKAHFCQLGIPRNDFKVLSEGALRIINFLPVSPQPGVCLGSAPSPTTKPWTNCENPNVMTQRHCFRNTTLSFCF